MVSGDERELERKNREQMALDRLFSTSPPPLALHTSTESGRKDTSQSRHESVGVGGKRLGDIDGWQEVELESCSLDLLPLTSRPRKESKDREKEKLDRDRAKPPVKMSKEAPQKASHNETLQPPTPGQRTTSSPKQCTEATEWPCPQSDCADAHSPEPLLKILPASRLQPGGRAVSGLDLCGAPGVGDRPAPRQHLVTEKRQDVEASPPLVAHSLSHPRDQRQSQPRDATAKGPAREGEGGLGHAQQLPSTSTRPSLPQEGDVSRRPSFREEPFRNLPGTSHHLSVFENPSTKKTSPTLSHQAGPREARVSPLTTSRQDRFQSIDQAAAVAGALAIGHASSDPQSSLALKPRTRSETHPLYPAPRLHANHGQSTHSTCGQTPNHAHNAQPSMSTNTQPSQPSTSTQPPSNNQSSSSTHTQPSSSTHTQPSSNTHTQPSSSTHAQPSSSTHAQPSSNTHTQPSSTTHTQPSSSTHTQGTAPHRRFQKPAMYAPVTGSQWPSQSQAEASPAQLHAAQRRRHTDSESQRRRDIDALIHSRKVNIVQALDLGHCIPHAVEPKMARRSRHGFLSARELTSHETAETSPHAPQEQLGGREAGMDASDAVGHTEAVAAAAVAGAPQGRRGGAAVEETLSLPNLSAWLSAKYSFKTPRGGRRRPPAPPPPEDDVYRRLVDELSSEEQLCLSNLRDLERSQHTQQPSAPSAPRSHTQQPPTLGTGPPPPHNQQPPALSAAGPTLSHQQPPTLGTGPPPPHNQRPPALSAAGPSLSHQQPSTLTLGSSGPSLPHSHPPSHSEASKQWPCHSDTSQLWPTQHATVGSISEPVDSLEKHLLSFS